MWGTLAPTPAVRSMGVPTVRNDGDTPGSSTDLELGPRQGISPCEQTDTCENITFPMPMECIQVTVPDLGFSVIRGANPLLNALIYVVLPKFPRGTSSQITGGFSW